MNESFLDSTPPITPYGDFSLPIASNIIRGGGLLLVKEFRPGDVPLWGVNRIDTGRAEILSGLGGGGKGGEASSSA